MRVRIERCVAAAAAKSDVKSVPNVAAGECVLSAAEAVCAGERTLLQSLASSKKVEDTALQFTLV